MAEAEKVDLSNTGGDGSREAGTGIGLAVADEAKSAEAAFLDAAVDNLADADVDLGEEEQPRKKRRRVKPVEDEADDDAGEEEQDAGEEETSGEDDEDEAAAGQDDQEGGDEGDEEEPDAKVSLRLNGKKANLEEILDHVGATVVIDGEDIDVTGSELIAGYQRGKDYANKTTELKQMKDDLVPYNQMVAYAKTDPKFTEYVQNYFENGPYPELTQNPLLRTTDAELSEMMDRNSAKYDADKANQVVKLRADWQSKTQERQEVNAKAQEDMQGRMQAWNKAQIENAVEIINGIGTAMEYEDKDGKGEYVAKSAQVLESLKAWGYTESEIAGQAFISATDARFAVQAYKASEYDRMVKDADAPRVTLGRKRKKLAPPRSQRSGTGARRSSSSKRQRRDSFREASKKQTSDSWITAIEKRLT